MDAIATATVYIDLQRVHSAINTESTTSVTRVPILMLLGHAFGFVQKAVDTPKKDGETNASYHERMDKLHWH